jgi:hypothetical protein
MAVRLYGGQLRKETIRTPTGKAFSLLNLPYYLAGKLEHYLKWAFSGAAQNH